MQTRVYSMTVQQLGDFDNYYEQNGNFRIFIGLLQTLVEETGGEFAHLVTPDNSPGRGGGGGGGNAGGGDGGAAGAAPVAAA